jgi:tight adherence protein C
VSAELVLLIGLVALFAALALGLSIVGAITTERAAVGRSLAAVEAMQSAPRRCGPNLTAHSATG